MKTLFKIVLVLILLVVIGVGALFFFKDSIVAGMIKSELGKATGTEVTLGDTNLDMGGGALTLDKLAIANPPDFTGGDVLAVQQFRTDLDMASLSGDTPRVKLVSLDGVAIRLEVKGSKVNLYELKKNLDQYAGPGDDDEPSSSDDKSVRVDKVKITNISVATVGSLPGVLQVNAGATVPDIELTDLEGTPAQITRQIMNQLINDVIQTTGLPNIEDATELLEGLGDEVGKQLKDQAKKQSQDIMGNLKDRLKVGDPTDEGGSLMKGSGDDTSADTQPADGDPQTDKPRIPLDIDLGGLDGVMMPKKKAPKADDAE